MKKAQKKMQNTITSIVTTAASVLIAWLILSNIWGDKLLDIPSDVKTEVTTDTLRFSDVKPFAVERIGHQDSTSNINIYSFADTTSQKRWSAEVLGRDVQLKSITMLEHTERQTRNSVVHRKPTWEVTLRSELNSAFEPWIGVGVERNFGAITLGVDAGANPITREPNITARGAITLWKR